MRSIKLIEKYRSILSQKTPEMTISDFCLKHGIKAWTYRYWHQKLKSSMVSCALPAVVRQPPAFVSVHPGSTCAVPECPVEMFLPNGIKLHFPDGIDRDQLQTIALLRTESSCCVISSGSAPQNRFIRHPNIAAFGTPESFHSALLSDFRF